MKTNKLRGAEMKDEKRRVELIITSSMVGALIGSALNNTINNFTLWSIIVFILLILLIRYFLIKEIKYCQI